MASNGKIWAGPLLLSMIGIIAAVPAICDDETVVRPNRFPSDNGQPEVAQWPAQRILFLGNSITLHGPAPAIGWTGNWGMAASEREKDYVHLVAADLAKSSGEKPTMKVRNIADFERGHDSYDIAKELADELGFEANIVVVAIGENVPELATEDSQQKYAAAFTRLLSTLKQHGKTVVFVRSSFWPNEIKDTIMRTSSEAAGATFIDISKLGPDKKNAASSERKIEHAGVAGHPGDQGMRAIADAIFGAIQKRTKSDAKP